MPREGIDYSQFYEILPLDGSGDVVVAYRGDGAATITGGGGRWDTVQRPKRQSVTLWRGGDPYTMDIPILFDGWMLGDSVEAAIARVNQIRFSPGALKEPPHLRINGALPVKGATWVLAEITWGNQVIWDTSGQKMFRLRQDATLHVLQYVSEKAFKGVKEFKVNDKVVTVKDGQGIEHHSGGDTKTKKSIQKKNSIRDPKTVKNKKGQKLIVTQRAKNLDTILRGIAGRSTGEIINKIS